MAVQSERRQHQRILVDWPVIVVTPQRYIGGQARNVSIGGAGILCSVDPGHTGPLRMVLQVPSREEFLQVTCVVVWSDPYEQVDELYTCETGVRFTSFIGDSRQYLSKMISLNKENSVFPTP